MNLFETQTLGYITISMGVMLLVIKIMSLNNEKLHEKFKNSGFNDAAFWVTIAGLVLFGLKLVFFT